MLDLAIIGGGLSGLALARGAQAKGLNTHLFEARSRFGGRIHGTHGIDLGPSWFWPGHDRMARICAELGVEVTHQYALGDAVDEDSKSVQRVQGVASMAGTFRIKGGVSALVDALVKTLDPARISLDSKITEVTQSDDGLRIEIEGATFVQAKRVVVTTPPRLAATMLSGLPAKAQNALGDIPGWMAGQAKIVAIYDHPVWRENGLSGDAVSRVGPMVEIHDASDDQTAALFGFVGIPAPARDGQAEALIDAARAQFTRLFGAPNSLTLQDWAQEPFTAARTDWDFNGPHPRYGCPPELVNVWDGKLHFGSTEFAATQGGFLEGALERAEELLSQMAGHPPPA